ncbi:hypothetical protein CWB99_21780 [Pseudoalteromonas rubra]|uniref:Uncharacterized protein n=1 Tax=Pseudoalteromonas rubra TaxID=43658 RepID=A0A5S3WFU1_9GAMM|nr:hypothetical protein [Pseudoalteromonas rubra]TMP24643.1 hypothetical protein CWB99_21780 [Pseudoalteromonas rubra]TMP36284.1 hypothetical protein CWC00_02245 [Pseudoalteromonas rubra]
MDKSSIIRVLLIALSLIASIIFGYINSDNNQKVIAEEVSQLTNGFPEQAELGRIFDDHSRFVLSISFSNMPVDNDEFEQRKVLYKNKVRSYICTNSVFYKKLTQEPSAKRVNSKPFRLEVELSSVEPEQAMGLLSLTGKECSAYR